MKHTTLIVALFLGTALLWSQSDKEKVEATVQKSEIEGHIYFLSDDLLQGRETGTPQNKIAASYLANMLRGYGAQPNPATGTYYQEVLLNRKSPPANLQVTLGGKALEALAPLEARASTYEGEAVYVGHGMESDYDGKTVAGKFVITKAGSAAAQDARSAFRLVAQKETLAREKGALGVIEILTAEETMWGFIEHDLNNPRFSVAGGETPEAADFDYIWVRDASGQLTESLQPEMPLRYQSGGQLLDTLRSQNVVGVVEGTDPVLKDEYIIYSAHYDHVGIGKPDEAGDSIYNGARDNAVGTTTVLSMAENLSRYPTKRSALFILFTGEEKGLLGSQYYVENPVLPLNKMVYCFNSDNGGYNDTGLATIIGLTRTTAESHIREAVAAFGLKAIEDPAPEQGLFERSDNVHFARKGIPAPTFSMGFSAFDAEIGKYYHQPRDEAGSLDFDYLLKFFRAYVMAGRLLGNAPDTPVWKAGDTYEAAGKALYGD